MDPLDEAVRGHARDIPQTTEEERRPLRVQHPLGPLLGSLPPDVLRNEVFARLDSRSRRYFVLAVCWPAMNDRARWKLYPQSYEWRQHVSIQVARAGDAELLRFAHEHGCPLDGETCEEAAERGHLDCLRYAHEHGCPWDQVTCDEAAARERQTRVPAVRARARVSVERVHVRRGSETWAPGLSAMRARRRLPVSRKYRAL